MSADDRYRDPRDQSQSTVETLRLTELRLDILMENLPFGVLFENEQRQVLYVNHKFCAMFECPAPTELAGIDWRSAATCLHNYAAAADVTAISNLAAAGQPVVKRELLLMDGRILECDCTPVLDGVDYLGNLWQFRDVTDERAANHEKLRDQALLNAVVKNVPVRLFASDRDNKMVKAWGPNWFGVENDDLEGDSLLNHVPEALAQQLRQRSEQIMSGETQHYEVEINGVIAQVSAVPWQDEDGEVIGVLGAALNVTEVARDRWKLAREHDFLQLMTEAATNLIKRRDIDDLLQRIVEAAAQVAGSEHGFIYMVEPDKRTMKMRVACGLFRKFIGFKVRKGEGLGGVVWLEGRPECVGNYDEWELRSAQFPTGITYGAVGVPLWSEGRVIGMIGVSHDTPDSKICQQELHQIEYFAHLAGLILENARLYAAAQSSRDRYRLMIEAIDDGYFETNASGRFRYVNPALERLLGYTKSELMGTPLTAYLDVDERAFIESFNQEILDAGQPDRALDIKVVDRDGALRIVELSASPIRADDDSRSIGLRGVMRDITAGYMMQSQLLSSQNQYYALVEAMGGGVMIQNADGQITACNEVARDILGVSREDVIAASLDQLDLLVIDEACQMVTAGELPPEIVLRAGQPQKNVVLRILDESDWSETWVAINAEPITFEVGGPVQGVVSALTDVTKTKQLEQIACRRAFELRHFHAMNTRLARLGTVAEVAQAGLEIAVSLSDAGTGFIALLEDDRLYMYATVGAYRAHALNIRMPIPNYGVVRRVLDSQTAELVADVSQDKDYIPTIPHIRSQMVIPLLSRDREPGVINLETHDLRRFTPEKFDLLKLLAGRIAAALDNVRLYEIKEQQRAELRAAESRLRDLEAFQSDMNRVLPHELNNLLSVIHTYLTLLADDLADRAEAFAPYFAQTRRALDRLQTMAADFLALAQVQTAQTRGCEFVNLSELVDYAFLEQRAAASEHDLDYKLDLGDGEQVRISGEPAQLQQAIRSLISNAIKFTPPGGEVCVRLRQARDCAIFEVEDTGLGVAPADQNRLFQPFGRIRAEETRDVDGVGLGLYLVKQVVKWHDGKLIVRSQPGRGSTFGFELSLLVQ